MSELEDLFIGRNPEGISNSDTEFVARVEAMINALPPEYAGAVRIISGYRSEEEQERLYQDYLNGTGNLAAPPGRSNHNHGLAMDLTFDSAGAKAWVHKHAGRFGLAFPIASEEWHIEPSGVRDGTYRPSATDIVNAYGSTDAAVAGAISGAYAPSSEAYFDQIPEVDNTSVEVQLKRLADNLMGGKFDVMRNMRVVNSQKLAEKNQEPERYV